MCFVRCQQHSKNSNEVDAPRKEKKDVDEMGLMCSEVQMAMQILTEWRDEP